jgi:hypothetical protein
MAFDVVLSHEVWEHVNDDARRAPSRPRPSTGGRLVVFVPNRLWLFETHGAYWRGAYHDGNIPLVNWLPDALRDKLAPHVRVYTGRQLRALFEGLPVRLVVLTQVFPGYDKIVRRASAEKYCVLTYAAERTPRLNLWPIALGWEKTRVKSFDLGTDFSPELSRVSCHCPALYQPFHTLRSR